VRDKTTDYCKKAFFPIVNDNTDKLYQSCEPDDKDLLIVKNLPCLFSFKGGIYKYNIY